MGEIRTLKNENRSEFNDFRFDKIFPIEGYSYEISITPRCEFWRVGLRCTSNTHGIALSTNGRYNDSNVRHIEVGAGGRPEKGVWKDGNVIQLQKYDLPNPPVTLWTHNVYRENSPVKLLVKSIHPGSLDFAIELENIRSPWLKLNILYSKVFEIFAWADERDFELDLSVNVEQIPLELTLEGLKALSNQRSTVSVGRLSIYFGRNNCGKTSILLSACKAFNQLVAPSADYLGWNRYSSGTRWKIAFNKLSESEKKSSQKTNREARCENTSGQGQPFDFIKELAFQAEETKANILNWMGEHFEAWTFEEIMKERYVDDVRAFVNNHDPQEQGTGARAVMPIIIQLFNPNIKFLAIDEPELGLEPRMQKIVFKAIKDASEGANAFPPKRMMIATHSHLFLDRGNPGNNFSVEKVQGQVSIRPVSSAEALQENTYDLLGANPSDLFFPSNIIIVEGRSDKIFLESIYRTGRKEGLFKSANIVFHFLDGIENLPYGTQGIIEMLKTQAYAPVYRKKICALLDEKLAKKGRMEAVYKFIEDDKKERFIIMEKPAIEYYYPISIINIKFNVSLNQGTFDSHVEKFLASESDRYPFTGDFMGHQISKVRLAELIAESITPDILHAIDESIIKLLTRADELGYE